MEGSWASPSGSRLGEVRTDFDTGAALKKAVEKFEAAFKLLEEGKQGEEGQCDEVGDALHGALFQNLPTRSSPQRLRSTDLATQKTSSSEHSFFWKRVHPS